MQEILLSKKKKVYNSDDPDLDVIYPETQGIVWTIPGTYELIVPNGVTAFCGVAIGGSAGTYSKGNQSGLWGTSAGGGGLGWKNAIPVTPGETLIVEVGAAGGNVNLGDAVTLKSGGRSCLRRGTTVLFAGNGGQNGGQSGSGTSTGGTFIGDGGGNGGGGIGFNYYTTGGGGAGGYNGAGGTGGTATNGTAYATAGAGGGGGGGGGDNGVTGRGGRGGGTGLFGIGSNGAVATGPNKNGGHGSYTKGTGSFGGGGSLSCEGPDSATPGRGGAVRVIWSVGPQVRAFPGTNVGPS